MRVIPNLTDQSQGQEVKPENIIVEVIEGLKKEEDQIIEDKVIGIKEAGQEIEDIETGEMTETEEIIEIEEMTEEMIEEMTETEDLSLNLAEKENQDHQMAGPRKITGRKY